MTLLPEVDDISLINLYGREAVIMHGDTLCAPEDVSLPSF